MTLVKLLTQVPVFTNNNNNNIHICIAPYGRNFRGASSSEEYKLVPSKGGETLKLGT